MYKIGEFSKITNIPTRTLRFYDEIGILRPSLIDKFTGYRYYSDNDILNCQIIKLLKYLGFTLEEIQRNKNNISRDLLENKKDEIIKQIEALKLKQSRIEAMMQELDNNKESSVNLTDKKYIKTNL